MSMGLSYSQKKGNASIQSKIIHYKGGRHYVKLFGKTSFGKGPYGT